MKIKNLILIAVVASALFACNCNSGSKCSDDKKTECTDTKSGDGDAHNAKNSLDVIGVYSKADSTMTVILTDGDNYEIIHGGTSSKGKYVWDETGNIINLDGKTYFVGENRIFTMVDGVKSNEELVKK